MIYQSGYLTIKDYDMEFNTFLLDFPNNEVKSGFLTMLASSYLQSSEDTGGWVRDKLDGTADEALRQIEEKGYAREYASDARTLYKIGASFSSQTGTIEDWKTV